MELAFTVSFWLLVYTALSVSGSIIFSVTVVVISLSVVLATRVAMLALSPKRTKRGMFGITITFLLATHWLSIIP